MHSKDMTFDLLFNDPVTKKLGLTDYSFSDMVNNSKLADPGSVCSGTNKENRRFIVFCGFGHNIVVTEQKLGNVMPIFRLFAKPRIVEQFGHNVVNPQLFYLYDFINIEY